MDLIRNEEGLTKEHFTVDETINVWLVSSLKRQDMIKKENMFLFVCSEAVESKLVKLETSFTVILPPIGLNIAKD